MFNQEFADRMREHDDLTARFLVAAMRLDVTSAGRYQARDPVGTHQVLVGTYYVFTTACALNEIRADARRSYASQHASAMMRERYGRDWNNASSLNQKIIDQRPWPSQ